MAKIDTSKLDTHKLKTPITAMYGYMQLLEMADNLTANQKNWVLEMIKETKRLLEMIEELKQVELEGKS